jgi:signal transduction histidine kinase
MNRFTGIVCFLLLPVLQLCAQQSIVDSLGRLITADKGKFTQPAWYLDIGKYYFLLGKKDSAIQYLVEGRQLAKAKNSDNWTCRMDLKLGGVYAQLGMEDSTHKYLDEAGLLLKQVQNDTLRATYFNLKGLIYMAVNDYQNGADYTIRALGVLDTLGLKRPPGWYIQTVVNLIICLKEEKQFDKAMEYMDETIKKIDYGADPPVLALLYYNASDLARAGKDTSSQKRYLDSARKYVDLYPAFNLNMAIKSGYASYFEARGDIKSALKLRLEAYNGFKEAGMEYNVPIEAMGAAESLVKMGQVEQAMQLYNEAMAIAKKYKQYRELAEAYRHLKLLYASRGNYKMAYAMADLFQQYSDSITTDDSKKMVQQMEAKYQNRKKEAEIAKLQLANIEQELVLVRRNRTLLMVAVLAIGSIVLLGLLYRNSQQKKAAALSEQALQKEQIKFLERQQQVVSLQSMVNGQETERTRIAKDLHDGLGGLFSTVKMYFSTLEHEQEQLKNNALFKKSYEMVDTAATEVRRIAHNMMPEVLLKLGLIQALNDLCGNITASRLLKVSLQVHGMEARLGPTTEIMLFRIVQELLNNIAKHAQATEAIVQFIREDKRLSITVEDNGKGFNASATEMGKQAGLESVKSRVDYLNGHISIESENNIGTTVMMDFLLDA